MYTQSKHLVTVFLPVQHIILPAAASALRVHLPKRGQWRDVTGWWRGIRAQVGPGPLILCSIYIIIYIYIWLYIYRYIIHVSIHPSKTAILVGGIPTPLKNMSQLGWWHSELNGKIKVMFQNHQSVQCFKLKKNQCAAEIGGVNFSMFLLGKKWLVT